MTLQETNSLTSNTAKIKKKERFNRSGKWFEIREVITADDMLGAEQLFRAAYDELKPPGEFSMEAIVRHTEYKLADPERMSYNAWIAYREGIPVGFIIGSVSGFYFSFDKQCHLDVWYVDKKYRGSACAFLLLKRLIQWGALRGAVRHSLEIIADAHTNRMVKAFETMASKLGFRMAGVFFVRDF